MSELAIKIEHVSKQYRLGAIGGGTLKGDLQTWMAKMRGKEDPNSKIGAAVYTKNEKFLALNDINLEIKKGEAVGIIGHNGAGKSTLLKLITRVTAPTTGNIYLNGRVASMLEVGTGFHPELSGRDNVYLNGAILGMNKSEIKDKFEEIVEFSEVRQFIDTPVKRYSSGMYVKLAFSVAAHLDSEIMIMDEVLAVGDVKFQQKCLDKMSEAAHKDGRTVLYVSHNMNTIRRLCDRCIVLDHGKVIFDGDVDKAIAIYLNNENQLGTKYDYANLYRSPNESRKLQMNGLTILDKEDSIFYRGEDINFILHCKVNENCSNIGLRFEIYYCNGTIAGTSFSDKVFSEPAGKEIDIHITLPTGNFVSGQYYVAALFYEYDSNGDQVGVDRVEPAIVFEVHNAKNDKVNWLHYYWGYTRFDDLMIGQIDEV